MKVLIVLVAVIALSSSEVSDHHVKKHEEWRGIVRRVYAECKEEPGIHVDQSLVDKYRQGEEVDLNQFNTLAHCMVKKLHYLTQEGDIDVDRFRTLLRKDLDKEAAEAIVRRCVHQDEDKEKRVLHFWNCLVQYRKHSEDEYDSHEN